MNSNPALGVFFHWLGGSSLWQPLRSLQRRQTLGMGDGKQKPVLWIKGSGGDIGSIKREGFATLHLDRPRALEGRYRGVEHEDETVSLYPLCTFGNNPIAASIDTPLHGFLPFPHVDHLHPDWGIVLATAANGSQKVEEFNRHFSHRLILIPWQCPGFELAVMLRKAMEANPGYDGVVFGGHGLSTWEQTQKECYLNTITIIDHFGQFVSEPVERQGESLFGGVKWETLSMSRFAHEKAPTSRRKSVAFRLAILKLSIIAGLLVLPLAAHTQGTSFDNGFTTL